jgi:membrane protease YdiL (CAAX protease family)
VIWQAYHFFLPFFPQTEWVRHLAYIATQIGCLLVFVVFVKHDDSDYEEHGFVLQEDAANQFLASIFLAIAYIFISISLPMLLIGYTDWSPIPGSLALLEIVKALFTSLAAEAVFRGYIQKNLTKAYMFLPALYISSSLFSFHRLPLASLSWLDTSGVLIEIASLFVGGIFLGFFFQRTDSLLGPVTFQTALLSVHAILHARADITPYTRLTLEITSYVLAIFFVDAFMKKEGRKLRSTLLP